MISLTLYILHNWLTLNHKAQLKSLTLNNCPRIVSVFNIWRSIVGGCLSLKVQSPLPSNPSMHPDRRIDALFGLSLKLTI